MSVLEHSFEAVGLEFHSCSLVELAVELHPVKTQAM